ILLERRSGRQRGALIVVDQLRINVLRGAEHRQPLAIAGGHPQHAAHAPLAPLDPIFELGHRRLRYFFFPSFREMRSVAFWTPCPCWASGGRNSRIPAPPCPPFWGSMPLIPISPGFGVAMVMPSGIG